MINNQPQQQQQQQQQQPQKQYRYTLQSTTFTLKLQYNYCQADPDKSTLSIILSDYVDWVVYHGYYGAGGYNMRVNACDAQADQDRIQNYVMLHEGKREMHAKVDIQDMYVSLSQARIKENKPEDQQIFIYKYGDVIMKKNIPYFKIEQNGRLTVYVSMMDKRRDKQVVYQSHLQLKQKQKMQQIQIIKTKYTLQKMFSAKQLRQLKKYKEQTKLKLEQQQKKITSLTQNLSEIQRYQKHILNHPITNNSTNKYQISVYPKPISLSTPEQGIQTFKVKIRKFGNTATPYFGLGIIDCEKIMNSTSYHGQNYTVAYYCWNANSGNKYPGGQAEGPGYKQNQTIQVSIDLANKHITWSSSGQLLVTHTAQIMADRSRVFMPYVDTYYAGTAFQWTT